MSIPGNELVKVDEYGLDPNLAFTTIFADPEWKIKSGVGAVFIASTQCVVASSVVCVPLVPIAFLAVAATQGYILRVIRSELTGDNRAPGAPKGLPRWNDWLDLMISGLTWMVVVCGQWIVIFLILTAALFIGNHYGALNAQSTAFKPWFMATATAVSLAVLFASFFLPLLMVNFAEQEKVSAALAVDEAFARLRRRPLDFVAVWMLNLSMFTLGVVVPAVTFAGLLFIPIILFFVGSTSAIMLAQVWKSAKA